MLNVSRAKIHDTVLVFELYQQTMVWLEKIGSPLWSSIDLNQNIIAEHIKNQELFISKDKEGEIISSVILQENDREYWPDLLDQSSSLFLHKLVIKRSWAKTDLSKEMLNFSKDLALEKKKKFLRLDCTDQIPALKNFYQINGFKLLDIIILNGERFNRFNLDLSYIS